MQRNAFGGYTFYGNRGYIGRTTSNNFGGHTYYNRYGSYGNTRTTPSGFQFNNTLRK